MASEDWWIWHCFFGLPGSLNDINVLQQSHLLARPASGDAPACNYTMNRHEYTKGYYLDDSIYPPWSTFVKTIPTPKSKAEAEFAKVQVACRKDIERAFSVLQARFAIVLGPARFWDKKTLNNIMMACVILHNMIIEDERDLNLEFFYKMLVVVFSQQEIWIGSKHFLRRTARLKTPARICSFRRISLSTIGGVMGSSSHCLIALSFYLDMCDLKTIVCIRTICYCLIIWI
jgi:hypothetical protein